MRRLLISILLASAAAAPAIAAQDSNDHRNNRPQAHEERAPAQAREQRAPSYNGPQRGEMQAERQQMQAERQQMQSERQQMQAQRQYNGEMRGQRGYYAGQGNPYANGRAAYDQQREAYAQQRDAYAQQRNSYMQGRDRAYQGGEFRRPYGNRGPAVSMTPRFGTQPALRGDSRRLEGLNWNRNWRNDERYDWRDYREHHRSRFHLGFYADPFGWGYQQFSIGWRLWPAYYGNQFWLDPSMYELPYPPPGCVWVRYWNDALLVDTYSGTVVDMIPGFFW